jgi:hypothetical protein
MVDIDLEHARKSVIVVVDRAISANDEYIPLNYNKTLIFH